MKLSNKDYARIIITAVDKDIDIKELSAFLWTDLHRNKKLKDLEEIIDLAKNLDADRNKLMKVKVTSAKEIAADDLEDIEIHLKQKYKMKIQFEQKIDESVGAGVIIEFNGLFYDLSLKDKIRKLRKAIAKQSS